AADARSLWSGKHARTGRAGARHDHDRVNTWEWYRNRNCGSSVIIDSLAGGTPRTRERIRVLCVEDHRVMLDGLALLIGRQPDMEVVASATSGEQAVELYSCHLPDITLMDLQLPTMSGLEAIGEIRRTHPDARIVVLTMYQGDEDIYRALEAGATAY